MTRWYKVPEGFDPSSVFLDDDSYYMKTTAETFEAAECIKKLDRPMRYQGSLRPTGWPSYIDYFCFPDGFTGYRSNLKQLTFCDFPKPTNSDLVEQVDEGRKDDSNKLPYELIAPELLEAIAEILAYGAKKYAPRNWEKGMNWSRVFGATMRHMWAWWSGEDKDEETGKSHLWHAACCIMFLIAYEERKVGKDDRPNSTST